MLKLFRTSLVFRATVSVVLVVLVVGAVSSLMALSLFEHRERQRADVRLEELLKTVENTASIACFLRDQKLAVEVSRGLMKNKVVESVTIIEEGRVLAQEGAPQSVNDSTSQPDAARTSALTRNIAAPFDASQTICTIRLQPNGLVIDEQVSNNSRLIFGLLAMQAVAVAMTLVFVIWKWITQPIKTISDQLHQLPVEDGAQLPVPHRGAKDEIGRMVSDVNDLIARLLTTLSEERRLRKWREREEKRFRTIFEKAETGIFVTDSRGQIASFNPAFARIVGHAGKAMSELDSLPAILDMPIDRFAHLVALATNENRVVTEDVSVAGTAALSEKWFHLVLNPLDDGVLQGLINDITDQKHAHDSAHRLALTDALTGIANRLGFEQHFSRLADGDRPYVLMLIDLDGFKQVNDTHGHDVGDLVLKKMARRFESTIRKGDFVGRLGGDEFVILLDSDIGRDGAERIAQQIIGCSSTPVSTGDGTEVGIGASVGIGTSSAGSAKERTFKDADLALYSAKRAGKNTYRFHSVVSTSNPVKPAF